MQVFLYVIAPASGEAFSCHWSLTCRRWTDCAAEFPALPIVCKSFFYFKAFTM